MTRRLQDPMPANVGEAQRRASDPMRSVWVTANAGSGKTYVLTQRVLRLLLSGARPEEILCLTYTKAAAAEMRDRVAARLARWALLPADALFAELTDLEGWFPTTPMLERARTLFAHALETPGGLRINTIHAFCESVLHRFPLEAGVPFDFAVVEEADAGDMIQRARKAVLAEGVEGRSAIAGAVDVLFAEMSDFSLSDAIDQALGQGRKLRPLLAAREDAKQRLRDHLGATQAATLAEIADEAVTGSLFPPHRYDELFAHKPPQRGKKNLTDKLWAFGNLPATSPLLFGAYLKDGGDPYKDRRAGGIKDAALATAIAAEHDRLAELYPHYRRATLIARSEALLDVLAAISTRYESQKRARSLLDFDDLVERMIGLLGNPEASDWVRYKLDAGITHILVDEGQDTNPEQWKVISAIVEEFFHGESAAQRPRTYFGVGDEKQSIYSFQGADPSAFRATGRYFAARAREAGLATDEPRLHISFRTLPGILDAVDKVFEKPVQQAAVLSAGDPVIHGTARAEPGGIVTLRPPIQEVARPVDPENWPVEPADDLASAQRRLAERIAGRIKSWVRDARPMGPRGRAVRPDDVLILVQTRSSLFFELIRALTQAGLPTAGADRLAVTTHIGVLDLLALGDVLLNPADDLQLAAVLRSPLFDVPEDDLMALAAARPGTLYDALQGSALPSVQEAKDRLAGWRARLDFERPYEFYADVLYREGGLKRFHARFGVQFDDLVAEFMQLAMAQEQLENPTLQGFLARMRSRDVIIKRELSDPKGGGVRVMTVHGAKGLESPIVILADAASKPTGRQVIPAVFIVPEPVGPLFIHASAKPDHTPETTIFRDAAQAAEDAEYWRRLYVAMTRAEDELYVTGFLTRMGKLDGTWYEAVEAALEPHAEVEVDAEGNPVRIVFPRDRPELPAAVSSSGPAAAERTPIPLGPLPPPTIVPVIRPSAAADSPKLERIFDTMVETAVDAEQSRRQGIALHALLQHLPRVPTGDWPAVAGKALAALLPEAPDAHAAVARRAIAILANLAFAEIFGPDSRAEVPFLLEGRQNGRPVRLAGRFDRLVVAKQGVLVVDYKSDAVPAGTVSGVSASYRTQLGLYAKAAGLLFPGLGVQAGILWTNMESLMILPTPMLDEAAKAFTIP